MDTSNRALGLEDPLESSEYNTLRSRLENGVDHPISESRGVALVVAHTGVATPGRLVWWKQG